VTYAPGVTYIIAEPCLDIKDKSCVDVCPVDCIHEAKRILVIDPEECIDCGACEPECPVEAIFPEDALPEKWVRFVRVNYAYGEGVDVVDRVVDELQSDDDDGAAGVREPRNPPPDAPAEGDALDAPQ
jgi:ferredoxin